MSNQAAKPPRVLRTIPCPQCGEKVDLSAEMLRGWTLGGWTASEKTAAWFACPNCRPKEAEQKAKEIKQWRERARHWRERAAITAIAREEKENQVKEKLLGRNCPPLERALYECLCGGELLTEDEVIEIVYKVADQKACSRYYDRLRQLARLLNRRFKRRRWPLRIVRPYPGWLFLLNSKDPEDLESAREEVRPPPKETRDEDRFWQRVKKLGVMQACSMLGSELDACVRMIRREWNRGARNVRTLEVSWAVLLGRPATLQRALEKLRAKRFRVGGKDGHWEFALPDKRNLTKRGKMIS